jgi:dimethylargininase
MRHNPKESWMQQRTSSSVQPGQADRDSQRNRMNFTRAIVRPPSLNFADGLTVAGLGAPRLDDALAQHDRYCVALSTCGLDLIRLPADPAFADSTFVEDTAVITPRGAIITHPGAPSRAGEVHAVRDVLTPMFCELAGIEPPGTLDGGDVCQADDRFLIGLSDRTNADGARQLAAWLKSLGYSSGIVDVRPFPKLLHLKSGVSYLGDGRLLVVDGLGDEPLLREFDQVRVPAGAEYGANCLRVNDNVLMPAGFPTLRAVLQDRGLATIAVEMSEFRKMDGGLSCLSLRM